MGPKVGTKEKKTSLPAVGAQATKKGGGTTLKDPKAKSNESVGAAKGGDDMKLPAIANPTKKNEAQRTDNAMEKEKEKAAAAIQDAATLKAEEEEKEKQRQMEEEEKVRVEAEEAERKLKGNGNVKLLYERYDEEFPIVDGSCTAAEIDDVYCLSFVMPNCLIHLSTYSPLEKREKDSEIYDRSQDIEKLQVEIDASDTSEERKEEIKAELQACWEVVKQELYIKEEPHGKFHGLEKDLTYYVYVEQEADQLARDQEKMRMIAMEMDGYGEQANRNEKDNVGTESCSCLFGNPCVDPYGCKDWDNRKAVAAANGWKESGGLGK